MSCAFKINYTEQLLISIDILKTKTGTIRSLQNCVEHALKTLGYGLAEISEATDSCYYNYYCMIDVVISFNHGTKVGRFFRVPVKGLIPCFRQSWALVE
jgi:hypothetical protein